MRPTSAKSTTSTVSRISMRSSYSTSGRRNRPFYRTPTTIKCTAYKNGHKDIFAEISAPNIKILLEQCTVKLGLTTAARKVFLSNGKEALLPSDIERGDDIYISCGEPFKDPTTCEKSNIEMKKSASWTVNGVVFAEERKKRKTKPALSKRLRSMLAQKNRRVMVFKNGDGQEMAEVVVSMDKFASFLDDCTSRLNLTTPARAAYTWHGVAITDLHDAPKLDKCLQTSTTPVIGPLWISKGEGFSPSGTKDFLKAVITHCKQKIKGLEQYKEQLEYAQDGEKDKVTVSKIQSMDDDDIYEEMKETDGHISTFKAALKKLREVNRNINIMVSQEEAAGHEYILGHIKEISSSDRLVGTPGIKIKVFQNGKPEREEVIYVNMKELSKGVNSGQKLGDSGKDPIDAKTFIMQRLLDQIGNRYGGACKPRRLFTKDSVEIKDVSELEHEQEVCFTLGENYKSSQVFVLQLQLDKVRGFNLFGERNAIMKEPLQADDYGAGREKHSQWEACIGFPLIYEFEDINMNMDQSSREHIMSNLKLQELDTKSHFMQLKDNLNLVLYPDVIVSDKKKWNDKGMWPPHGQTWVISKSGMISCKAMPSMSLTATEYKIDATLPDKTTELHGFAVAMQKKMLENPAQQWGFSPEGFIYSLAQPSLVLTFIGDLSMESDPICVGDSDRQYTGQTCAIAVVEKFAAKHSEARRQRFAIKQEILHKMGQWKHSKVDNPLWNKLAYSWPVTEDGTWNETWAWLSEIECLRNSGGDDAWPAFSTVLPIRLRVLKNGERDFKRAALVVGPDLTNVSCELLFYLMPWLHGL
uniref:Uncharacterized protein LOC100377058 n=1 Tax=Saccoglossus kowalevskii TaxID=10224 RepID=A0ABM0N0G8_SACKO|nr:PREDICTED: uncharacterized protein LOC100377058 [Saccoglossus kowalevskii]